MTEHDPKVKKLDARSLRGLAHPLRVKLLSVLRTEGPATSARLAKQLGEDSGNVSWHLRQLANTGFIEEEAGRGTRRERWWRAVHDYTAFNPADFSGDAETEGPLKTLLRESLRRDFARAAAFLAEDWPPEWQNASGFSGRVLRMTAAELNDFVNELDAMIARRESTGVDGAEEVLLQVQAFPRRRQEPLEP